MPLSLICFQGIDFTKEKPHQNFSYERTEELYVQDCSLADYEFGNFLKVLDNVTYINFKNVKGLKYFGGEKTIFTKRMEIKHLKTLLISECEDLHSLDLKCDILESVSLKKNKNLTGIYLDSINLKNIYVSKCVQLQF